jgi:hypothetical protein
MKIRKGDMIKTHSHGVLVVTDVVDSDIDNLIIATPPDFDQDDYYENGKLIVINPDIEVTHVNGLKY